MTDLKLEAENLEDKALDMKKQITMLQESNVKGALNLTREAKNRAEEARIKVETIQSDGGDLKNSELQRTRTERKIELKRAGFKDSRCVSVLFSGFSPQKFTLNVPLCPKFSFSKCTSHNIRTNLHI